MTGYVFDAEPLIAYFYDEPGADDVGELLGTVDAGEAAGTISRVIATEMGYRLARLETANRIVPSRPRSTSRSADTTCASCGGSG